MPYKCNLFFNDPNGGGWSETYYNNNSNAATVRTNLDSLASARQQLLAGNVQLTNCRDSDDQVTRDGFLFPPTPTVSQFKMNQQDYSFVSQDVRLYSDLSHWRFLYLRGIPDVIFNPPDAAADAAKAAWYAQLDIYIAALVAPANGWSLKVYDRGAQKFLIDTFTELANEVLSVKTVDLHGLVPGDYVHFTGIGSPSPRLGTQVYMSPPGVLPVEGHTVYVRGVLPQKFSYTGKGFLQKYGGLYQQITTGVRGPLNHRDTGRPFGQHRGRASKRP